MAVGASMGYEHANAKALDLWHEIYGTDNLIALTDTFTTEAFFKVCATASIHLWNHSDTQRCVCPLAGLYR
jgi:nicotinate phosphoribosyltransferase